LSEQLEFHEVTAERWTDLERLFEASGGPKYCWCMVWRSMARGERKDSTAKKTALLSRVQSAVPIGILGYRGTDPVAWCSIAPREAYRDFVGKSVPADKQDNVWSLVCLFVPRKLRGRGLTKRIIAAAIDHARAKGAGVVEAYPVDPESPSYRFMGLVPSLYQR